MAGLSKIILVVHAVCEKIKCKFVYLPVPSAILLSIQFFYLFNKIRIFYQYYSLSYFTHPGSWPSSRDMDLL
jgi:hypothetical protein